MTFMNDWPAWASTAYGQGGAPCPIPAGGGELGAHEAKIVLEPEGRHSAIATPRSAVDVHLGRIRRDEKCDHGGAIVNIEVRP